MPLSLQDAEAQHRELAQLLAGWVSSEVRKELRFSAEQPVGYHQIRRFRRQVELALAEAARALRALRAGRQMYEHAQNCMGTIPGPCTCDFGTDAQERAESFLSGDSVMRCDSIDPVLHETIISIRESTTGPSQCNCPRPSTRRATFNIRGTRWSPLCCLRIPPWFPVVEDERGREPRPGDIVRVTRGDGVGEEGVVQSVTDGREDCRICENPGRRVVTFECPAGRTSLRYTCHVEVING